MEVSLFKNRRMTPSQSLDANTTRSFVLLETVRCTSCASAFDIGKGVHVDLTRCKTREHIVTTFTEMLASLEVWKEDNPELLCKACKN